MIASSLSLLLLAVSPVLAHVGFYAPGMYCRNGTSGSNQNANDVVNPLFGLSKKDWWMQHDRGCDARPPPAGEYLELPAGGVVTGELAHNQAFTTLTAGGKFASDWPDGKQHPEDWNGFAADPGEGCIQDDGAMHVQNQGNATGTALAISYQSELAKVTMENLVVFTVAAHTPWKRVVQYQVPADLPACPDGGCTCAWLWAPNGCGQRNVYLQPYKCIVTGSKSSKTISTAKPPVYCKDDATKCIKGGKQAIIFAQLEGNNVENLQGKSPGYNEGWGFRPGAQNDIFVVGGAASVAPSGTATSANVSTALSSSLRSIVVADSAAQPTASVLSKSSSLPVVASPVVRASVSRQLASRPISSAYSITSVSAVSSVLVSAITSGTLKSSVLPTTLSTRIAVVSPSAKESSRRRHRHERKHCAES